MLVNMNDVLLPAKKGHYGIGFFNAVNVEMARAIIETAEELRAPVMVGTAEVLLPAMSLERVAEYLIPMAQKAAVPVCVHYDHGLTFDKCMEALKLGFTSVMYDCSTEDYESNTAKLAEMVRICHGRGVTVEGELGHVGDNEGTGKLENPSDYYTDPEIAIVGMTEAQAKDQGIDVICGKFIMSANGKSLITKEERGFIKVVTEAGKVNSYTINLPDTFVSSSPTFVSSSTDSVSSSRDLWITVSHKQRNKTDNKNKISIAQAVALM